MNTILDVCFINCNKRFVFQGTKLHFSAQVVYQSYLSVHTMKKCICFVSCLILVLRGRKECLCLLLHVTVLLFSEAQVIF